MSKALIIVDVQNDFCAGRRLLSANDCAVTHVRRQVGSACTTGAAAYPFQTADRANGVAGAGVSGREKAREHIHSQAFLPLNLERALD